MTMFDLSYATRTDVGLKRQVNEDAVRVFSRVNGGCELLAVVADGMGGHGHGDLASRIAVQAVGDAYRSSGEGDPAAALREAVTQANRAVFFAAQQDCRLRGMGTTCTAVAIQDGAAFCAHVGDSRLYLVRGGALYAMTMDHSQVGELVAQGLMTAAEAKVHHERNVLLRALGTAAEVAVEAWEAPFPLRDGDRLLLCTDGLHGLVADADLARAMALDGADAACRELIALARAGGGDDNITAAVIDIRSPEPKSPDSPRKPSRAWERT